jgi:hypothetical protein
MRTSRFFHQLRSAYQAELDDLTFDSEGQNVLRKRLNEKRKELGFLRQMIELSPEMVAVVFHQGFQFSQSAAMDRLVGLESDQLTDWSQLQTALQMRPWTQELVNEILKEPKGEWFLCVAAGLEYLHGKAAAAPVSRHQADASDDDDREDGQDDDESADLDEHGDDVGEDEEEREAREREDAGADWMVEQGFDRKD